MEKEQYIGILLKCMPYKEHFVRVPVRRFKLKMDGA